MSKPKDPSVRVASQPTWSGSVGHFVQLDWALREFSPEAAIEYGLALIKAGLKAQQKEAEQ